MVLLKLPRKTDKVIIKTIEKEIDIKRPTTEVNKTH